MYLDNKLVFLAGATGLAGTSIIKYILDNYPSTKIRASFFHTKPFIKHEKIEYVYGDLKSQKDCREMVKGCDCAIMAAASTGGSNLSNLQPLAQVNENIVMNAQMLEAFYFEHIKRVVYIGSATLYQEFHGHIKEDELDLNKDPHPAYLGVGWVVRFIEKLCKFWHEKYEMEILISRTSNIYGPYAKFNPAISNFIPAIIRNAVDKVDPFEVWGTPDVIRDVIYSEDFARAIVTMLDNEKIKFDIFNIGSGTRTTVDEVVKLALEYAEHRPSIVKYNSSKPTTIKFRGLEISKAKNVLNWQPRYTIDEGIKKTTQWWISNKNEWKK